MEVIEKAIKLLGPLAQQYKPRQEINWISYSDNDDIKTLFDANDFDYCEICVDDAVREWQEKANSGELEVPKGTVICFQTETVPEREDFCRCEKCGEIIVTSFILTDQEVEHWETHEDIVMLSAQEAYELNEVLGYYGNDQELDPRLEAIAQRVIEEAEKLIEKAKKILKPTAQKFTPPAMLYAVNYDTGEELNTDDQYCENCRDRAEKEYREIHPDIADIQSIEEDSGNLYDGFQICRHCGEVMNVLSNPWVEDLELYETGEYEITLVDPKSSWLLLNVLDWFDECRSLDGRVLNLARRVIEKEEKGEKSGCNSAGHENS